MDIQFSMIQPAFVAEHQEGHSDIWGKELCIPTGQRWAVSGASGKGKSTFLNYIFGTRSIPNGRLKLGTHDLTKILPEQRSELRSSVVSMVFQDLQLFDNLTAAQNLKLKWDKDGVEDWSTIERWCQELEVDHLLDREVCRLSLGQQQRFAVVRGLIQPFVWLLMDEPTSHLDSANTKRVHRLVGEVCATRGAGAIVSTLASTPEFDCDKIIFC